MGEKLDLKNPKTLNEKIQWLIINRYGIKEANLSDKVLSKKILKNKNIDKLEFPKTLYCIENVKKENINELKEKLPDRFVLKCNHGSGNVFVCQNKNEFDFKGKLNILKKDLKKDYSRNFLEYHYALIKPRIFFEEYLDDSFNPVPLDYKFFCFNGEAKVVMVCSGRKNGKYDATFFDENWNTLNYSTHPSKQKIVKPTNLSKMFEIASELSKDSTFVRIDLYNINGKIYFGEMTFTPAAGMSKTYTDEADRIMGDMLKL